MAGNAESERAIRDIVEALVVAWNRHDAGAFAASFAEDANFTNVFGMSVKGRGAIEALHEPIFRTMFKDSRLSVTETRIRFLRPDLAAVDVRWEMSGARDPQGREWPDRRGLLSFIATERHHAWSIDVFHNMDLPAPGLAKAQAELSKT
jgi:uncharacterized protein (TIGR02246 family)